MNILVTGSAGFIGFHLVKELLERGDKVISIDNLNDYYDVTLKEARLKQIKDHPNHKFYKENIADLEAMKRVFEENEIDKVCHLAAQAGVRYSLINPFSYEETNVKGTLNLLELAKQKKVKNFVMASSSSVYGGNTKVPFSEGDRVDSPVSLYAATKRANELMGHTYHHLFGMNIICLRFFTVYGPWGRPDMALFMFTKNIIEGKPIDVYNFGKMKRDFTFITDIVKGVLGSIDNELGFEILNIGNSNTVELSYFIECIENELGKKAEKNLMEIQPGDVPATFADIEKAKRLIGFNPTTNIEEGIRAFVKWYKEYYGVE